MWAHSQSIVGIFCGKVADPNSVKCSSFLCRCPAHSLGIAQQEFEWSIRGPFIEFRLIHRKSRLCAWTRELEQWLTLSVYGLSLPIHVFGPHSSRDAFSSYVCRRVNEEFLGCIFPTSRFEFLGIMGSYYGLNMVWRWFSFPTESVTSLLWCSLATLVHGDGMERFNGTDANAG